MLLTKIAPVIGKEPFYREARRPGRRRRGTPAIHLRPMQTTSTGTQEIRRIVTCIGQLANSLASSRPSCPLSHLVFIVLSPPSTCALGEKS